MSARSCCLKIKECEKVFAGKTAATLSLLEYCEKDGIPLPPKVENDLVLMINNAIVEAEAVNGELRELLGL